MAKATPHTQLKNQLKRWLTGLSAKVIIIGQNAGRSSAGSTLAGLPDCYVTGLPEPYPARFWVEVKAGRDKLRPAQTATIERLRQAGDLVFVVYSLEELKAQLEAAKLYYPS